MRLTARMSGKRATIGSCSAASHSPARPIEDLAGKTLSFPLGVYIDNLSVVMFLMVTFIATLIHIYSMGYMHDDSRYPRFFAFLSLFCFSMLGLVASANVFMVFIFWELVGVCSYLLIGFWYERNPTATRPTRRSSSTGSATSGSHRSGDSVDTWARSIFRRSAGSAGPPVQFNRVVDASGPEVVQSTPPRLPPSTHSPCKCLTGC